MMNFLNDLLSGWRVLRTSQGYSYEVSRSGERRVVPVEDYGRLGEIDSHWIATGEFIEETMRRGYRKSTFKKSRRRVGTLLAAV